MMMVAMVAVVMWQRYIGIPLYFGLAPLQPGKETGWPLGVHPLLPATGPATATSGAQSGSI